MRRMGSRLRGNDTIEYHAARRRIVDGAVS